MSLNADFDISRYFPQCLVMSCHFMFMLFHAFSCHLYSVHLRHCFPFPAVAGHFLSSSIYWHLVLCPALFCHFLLYPEIIIHFSHSLPFSIISLAVLINFLPFFIHILPFSENFTLFQLVFNFLFSRSA